MAPATAPAALERTPSMIERLRRKKARPTARELVVGAGEPNDGKDLAREFKCKDNSICTGKYNVATFVPKGLYEQFRRVANLYFLSVAVISLFPTVSPIQPYTTWTPLTLVIGLSLIKEAVEDYKRHVQDRVQNTSATERFNGGVVRELRVARLEGWQHCARGARPVFPLRYHHAGQLE